MMSEATLNLPYVHNTRRGTELTVVEHEKPYIDELEILEITPEDTDLWHQYGALRARVYIDERNFLPESARNEYGEEFDEDEARSVHIVQRDPDGRVVGCVRLIKRSDDAPLPVEQFFQLPDIEPSGIEASRLIVDKSMKGAARKLAVHSLVFAAIQQPCRFGSPYLYATLEKPLQRILENIGIPMEQLTPALYLEKYNTPNMAMRIPVNKVGRSIEQVDKDREESFAPFFWRQKIRNGIGRVSLGDLVVSE